MSSFELGGKMPKQEEALISHELLGAVSDELQTNAKDKPALKKLLQIFNESPTVDSDTIAIIEKVANNDATPEEVSLLQNSLTVWINGNR